MKLRVGHMEVTLQAMDLSRTKDDGVRGLYLPEASSIEVDPSMPARRQAEVLIHELVHAAWDAYGVAPRVDEETAATTLGKALAAILGANPVLFDMLEGALVNGRPIVVRRA